MSAELTDWTERFGDLIRAYLAGAGESALQEAYTLGREALEAGLGVLDVSNAYHAALATLLVEARSAGESAGLVDRVAVLFAESLSPFEMVRRGFGEAVGALQHMNDTLEQQVAERTAALRRSEESYRHVAEEREILYREAQDALHVRELFFSVASHELKTPLTALFGNARLLERRALRDGTLSERDQRLLRAVSQQAARLDKLINMLLDISRITTGQLVIEHAPLDLAALTQRVVEEARAGLERHTLEFTLPADTLHVLGDEMRLEQVLQNLISNAIKYSPDGGPIEVHLERRGGLVCLSVSDRGIGIPAASLSEVFGRFYRAPNTQASHLSGMGIGLYVVKEIVNLHRGEVDVQSTEGAGSTFTVQLPALQVAGTVAGTVAGMVNGETPA